EFLGRVDEQVKIRGFRVELGEIEKQLTQLPDIDAAVVQIQKDQHGQAHLVAYIQQNSTTCESDIRAALRQQLPDYMQPSHFVVLQTWPLTANGKLDKKALPKVDFELHSGASISPPKTPLEHALIKAWQAAKPIEQPCVTTPLFAQGVDSLSLVKIKHHITLAGFDVSMQQVMTHQTIRALAQSIEKGEKAHTKPTPIVRLNQSSATTLLYLIHPYGGGVEMYRELAQQLQPQAKVYGLVAPFMSGQTVQFNDLDELAKRYTQTIQAHIQENANSEIKLVLGGFSYGGALSSLITEQLIEQNIPVDSLLMFDSSTENLKKSTQHHFVDRMCNILSAMEIPLPDDATMAMWRNDPAQHQALCAEYMHQKFAGQISDLDIKAFIDFHDQLELAEAINQHVNQDVPVHFFYNRDHVGAQSNIARWKARYSNNLHAYPMGFNHHEFMSEDAVKQIMTMLKEVL
ncbi:hypothetical protein J8M20_21890, partial [Pseudoalteromonas luteoviolacea]|uniref:thioesterase domain-containing protein n=1 Tax=Pseudoalteromonas luteoviolacea TaxID=43657 RepID=UPI001B5982FD